MGQAVVGLGTSQKKEPGGAPFTAGSAYNGTSIDGTGKVVLGNDLGDPAQPAALISDREIVTQDALNQFAIRLNAILFDIVTNLNGSSVDVIGGIGTVPQINLTTGDAGSATLTVSGGVGSTAFYRLLSDADFFQIAAGSNPGFVDVGISNAGLPVTCMRFESATQHIQVGPTLQAFNGADLQVSGTTTGRMLLSSATGAVNVDRELDSGKLFVSGVGATTLNLPNMSAANARPGFNIRATCNNASGVTIQLSAGQTLRFGSLTTSVAGTITSIDVGAYIRIVNISPAIWVTETFNGAWVLT